VPREYVTASNVVLELGKLPCIWRALCRIVSDEETRPAAATLETVVLEGQVYASGLVVGVAVGEVVGVGDGVEMTKTCEVEKSAKSYATPTLNVMGPAIGENVTDVPLTVAGPAAVVQPFPLVGS